jgi:hypothetical protein
MKLYRNVDQHVLLCMSGFFRNVRVIALDLVKICNFQLVSHVTQKGFDIVSLNITGRLLSICWCAPWDSLVDLSTSCRIISLDLLKPFLLCCVICSLSAWVRINQLYRNNDQHHLITGIMINIAVKLCTCNFVCGFFSVLLELLPLTYSCINLHFSTCSCIAQKVFDL